MSNKEKRKILNSARNLAILGLEGFGKISEYSSSVKNGDEKNIQISNGIETMIDSLKNAILQQNIELLKLPFLLDFYNLEHRV